MKIQEASIITSAVGPKHYPEHDLAEVLLLGRSNVGKSSFINTIINRKALARTSSQPGKTRTVNFYNAGDLFCFVDMPGYGYAKVSKRERESFQQMIGNYIEYRENLALVVQLIDFRHPPTKDDISVHRWLESEGITPLVVATKGDKVPKNQKHKHIAQIAQGLDIYEEDVLVFSKETKEGKLEAEGIIEEVLAAFEGE
ncbi:MAG TPA: YihA family ribosome biogenesis GTP-binding protein [Eubacteriaceae bacterium]|nr:YihA family ribosome biogenesis GTP-binding protein [Eubacteriaceae bacterium]